MFYQDISTSSVNEFTLEVFVKIFLIYSSGLKGKDLL